MGRYKKVKGAVSWHLPKKKSPFAYSTLATADLIEAIARENHTVSEAIDVINYDFEAKAILQVYVNAGYGNTLLSKVLDPY